MKTKIEIISELAMRHNNIIFRWITGRQSALYSRTILLAAMHNYRNYLQNCSNGIYIFIAGLTFLTFFKASIFNDAIGIIRFTEP